MADDKKKKSGAVLCVDDEEFVLNSLKRTFRRQPYKVLFASSGPEALDVLEREQVQVVIADQRMPGMKGTELLRVVKQRWPHIIRIILSGYPEVPELLSAINQGEVYRFVSKPWDADHLLRLISSAMEQSRVIEEMMAVSNILQIKGDHGNEVNFKVENLGNIIRMELAESKHPMTAEQITECLRKIFNLQSSYDSEFEIVGGALVRQNGRLTFISEVGENLQLILEFPVETKEAQDEG